ncbi:MAG TPA: squalene/phytoene synthase family protein [Luteolibacter sp.]|nr:squalene/phytoene synthase family protein [Luteolibacter sp.]
MNDRAGKQILKEVSRSFYLTLRLLPKPMREAASLGYLIARTSDTIADTEGLPVQARSGLLEDYADSIAHGGPLPIWPEEMLGNATQGERALLERADAILDWLGGIDPQQARLIREVVATIIGGQLMDLRIFGCADVSNPIALPDVASLDTYTWSVAGCVGAFWTKLGFLTLGGKFSNADPDTLLEAGIRYGKGLQLVNILRDLPEDLEMGRCYLPVADPADRAELMRAFEKWRRQAVEWISDGRVYSETLGSRRLRASSVLPALIAGETLDLLEDPSWDSLQAGIKVPRRTVYRLLVEALFF